MNKLYCILLIVIFCRCGDDKKSYLSLSDDTLTYAWDGKEQEIFVYAEDAWWLSSSVPSWITVYPSQGYETARLTIAVSTNKTQKQRSATIRVNTSSESQDLLITQNAQEELAFVGCKWYEVDASGTELSVDMNRNVTCQLKILPQEAEKWVFPVEDSGMGSIGGGSGFDSFGTQTLVLRIAENRQQEERQAEVIIYNTRYELSDTLYVTQKAGSTDYYCDGDVVCLQQASQGDVNLVVMGDGFVGDDLAKGGRYEVAMKQATDYFFSIEPYQSYRDYFHIHMVVAESAEAGVGQQSGWGRVNNKFGSTFGTGTEITCNDDLVFEYAYQVEELPHNKPVTILVVLNSTKYAGTTYLYADGNAIALCPMSEEESPNDFEGLVHHEAGGHGFGFLCDEYVYYPQTIPSYRVQEIKEWQKWGYQMNLDFTDDTSVILWKDFIGVDKYSGVGAYEGGFEYQYGVWRPEENSCMNNNVPYFNAQSRWCIVNRIMQLSDINYSIQDFMQEDHVSLPETKGFSSVDWRPLGSPLLIRNR